MGSVINALPWTPHFHGMCWCTGLAQSPAAHSSTHSNPSQIVSRMNNMGTHSNPSQMVSRMNNMGTTVIHKLATSHTATSGYPWIKSWPSTHLGRPDDATGTVISHFAAPALLCIKNTLVAVHCQFQLITLLACMGLSLAWNWTRQHQACGDVCKAEHEWPHSSGTSYEWRRSRGGGLCCALWAPIYLHRVHLPTPCAPTYTVDTYLHRVHLPTPWTPTYTAGNYLHRVRLSTYIVCTHARPWRPSREHLGADLAHRGSQNEGRSAACPYSPGTRHSSAVTRHSSAVTRDSSAVARDSSAVARHSSAVARHSSAVTRHSSTALTLSSSHRNVHASKEVPKRLIRCRAAPTLPLVAG